MKNIIAFFTNRIVISMIGLIILSLLVWFIAPEIKFGEQNQAPLASEIARIIAIVGLSLVWGIYQLIVQLKESKNNASLVNDLQAAPDNSADILAEQSSDEMNQMSDRFNQALTTLKKLNFKGSNSKSALYELPWYIIIGPPGSGKTTALVNSSLDFPLVEEYGKGALQGVGGTRNCDWWFTNDAVLIDTAGRYTTQDSHKVLDSSAWEGFLKLLKKHRRRRPINGAIVAISIQDLLTQTEDQRAQHAKTIRLRIDELMDKLEVRFPVYLMFTKCDLVSGFSEFFEDLGKEEREQVLGVTLPDSPQQDQAPDFSVFNTEYSNIIKRLYERVLWRIHSERDIKRRSAIQGFPQQMENLQGVVDSFVQQTFAKNRYRFQPYLRGVYFTSGTQDGTPIDRLMSSVSSNFGFNSESIQSPLHQGKSYFLGRLFKQVIFPEAELVGTNRLYEKILKWTQRLAYTAMVGASAALLFFWTNAFTQHEDYMRDVDSFVADYQESIKKENKWSTDLRLVLPSLNALANASIVYDQDQHPWMNNVGMYDDNIDDAANNAYHQELLNNFQPKLIKYLEQNLKSNNSNEALYNTFRTYVMFNKLEHMNIDLVAEWFDTQWSKDFIKDNDSKLALVAHLDTLLNLELTSTTLNKQIVASTRLRLLRMPISQRIYQRIKTKAEYMTLTNVLNDMGEGVRDNYKMSDTIEKQLTIPVLYTKLVYDELDFTSNSEFISRISQEKWLLHDESKGKIDFINQDLDVIGQKVKDLYLADYNKKWQNIYNALTVKPINDLMQVNNTLTNFSDPMYSPISAILATTVSNTQLSNQMAANMADDNQGGVTGAVAGFAAGKVEWTAVDKKFRSINLLLRESKQQPPAINSILMKIAQLQEVVNTISLAPDPAFNAFELVKARYQNGSSNAITALRSFAKNKPEPIKRWLTTLADETWRNILRTAHQHINNEWRNNVYQPYLDGLSGRYPLNKTSDNDIALFDFVAFFKPNGTVDKFYLTYVKPFITTRKGWHNKTIDKYNLGLSSATLGQIKRALEIKKVLFRENADSPHLGFSLKPNSMPKSDVRFLLEVGDNRISYSHGPKFWKTLNWSADSEQNRVRIVFEDTNEQQHSDTFEGPWAWFRLLDQANVTKTNESSTYMVTFRKANATDDIRQSTDIEHKISYKIRAKSVNNPFEKQLLSLFRCPEKI